MRVNRCTAPDVITNRPPVLMASLMDPINKSKVGKIALQWIYELVLLPILNENNTLILYLHRKFFM